MDFLNDDLFDDNEEGKSATDISEILEHATHLIEDHHMPVSLAIEGLLNTISPGKTDMSTDILNSFQVGMNVAGYREVASNVAALWLSIFPWGVGVHMAFKDDYPQSAISKTARKAIVKVLTSIMQTGGINAEFVDDGDDGKIRILKDDGEEQDVIVGRFREELDAELGPDAPAPPKPPDEDGPAVSEWMKRWLP